MMDMTGMERKRFTLGQQHVGKNFVSVCVKNNRQKPLKRMIVDICLHALSLLLELFHFENALAQANSAACLSQKGFPFVYLGESFALTANV